MATADVVVDPAAPDRRVRMLGRQTTRQRGNLQGKTANKGSIIRAWQCSPKQGNLPLIKAIETLINQTLIWQPVPNHGNLSLIMAYNP